MRNDFNFDKLDKNYTCIFEVIHPDATLAIPYEKSNDDSFNNTRQPNIKGN